MPVLLPGTLGALRILSRMREIVANDMLKSGCYISPDIVSEALAEQGAICGGRNVCAIGSLWLAADIKPFSTYDSVHLPGAWPYERMAFLASRPALSLAYRALNTATAARIDDRYVNTSGVTCMGEMERAFEGRFEGHVDDKHPLLPQDLPALIDEAELLIATGKVC